MANPGIALRDISRHDHSWTSRSSIATSGVDTSITDSEPRLTEQAHVNGSSEPPNLPQAATRSDSGRHSTELGHQPLLSEDTDPGSDDDDIILSSKGTAAKYLAVFAWWKPEPFASFLSIATFACTIAVLRMYDGVVLTELDLPKSLTLNGIVAALATVNRACLNTPVCSALLQQMWLYLSKESNREGTPRSQLRDMELYTDASTGAWGSLVFLCKARISKIAACFGCLITILSLAYSTFTQQLISIELLSTDNVTSPGNLPRSETLAELATAGQRFSVYPPLNMLAGVYAGMIGSSVRPVQASCPTANCTWPVTPSVAVCGSCVKSTFGPAGCNTTCPYGDPVCNVNANTYCNYTLPSGAWTQLFNFVEESAMTGGGVGFQIIPSFRGSVFNQELDNRAYFMNLELFGVPFGWRVSEYGAKPRGLDLKNTECALWMCVQAYNTTIASNIQHDEIVATFDEINTTDYLFSPTQTRDFQLPAVPAYLDPSGQTNFTAARQALGTLQKTLFDKMKGNVSISAVSHTPSNDLIYGAWNGTTNASAWIANVAISLTNVMRSTNVTQRDQYNGAQYELTVTVRWEWIILPAALVLASLVYLLVVMFQTASSPVHSWKGSPLTLLLFKLDPDISQAAHGQVDKQGGALKSIGDTKVRMLREAGGIRKLHAC